MSQSQLTTWDLGFFQRIAYLLYRFKLCRLELTSSFGIVSSTLLSLLRNFCSLRLAPLQIIVVSLTNFIALSCGETYLSSTQKLPMVKFAAKGYSAEAWEAIFRNANVATSGELVARKRCSHLVFFYSFHVPTYPQKAKSLSAGSTLKLWNMRRISHDIATGSLRNRSRISARLFIWAWQQLVV